MQLKVNGNQLSRLDILGPAEVLAVDRTGSTVLDLKVCRSPGRM